MNIRATLCCFLLVGAAASTATSQVTQYGSPSPAGFGTLLSSGTQQAYLGNGQFRLQLDGTTNALGAAIFVSLQPGNLPLGNLTLLLDPLNLVQVQFPMGPGTTALPLPLPANPFLAGHPAYFQAIEIVSASQLGATNGVSVNVLRHRTPMRAYIPGQDFSFGANAPGQFATLDFSQWPPTFRATQDVGYAGNISDNFPVAIAVSDRTDYAFLHGNGANNPMIRILDISQDPTGANPGYPVVGDIPLPAPTSSSIGYYDLEVTSDGRWLFGTTGQSPKTLEVWDLSGLPGTVPMASVQSFNVGSGSGSGTLEVSADDRFLAVCIGPDSGPDVILYEITSAAQPLVQREAFNLAGSSGGGSPSAIDFSPDSSYLLAITGSTYTFADVTSVPANILVNGGTWTTTGTSTSLPRNGGALALQQGNLVGIAGEESTGSYQIIDLQAGSPTFGTVIDTFSTNPGGNISNHRIHALANIVVATDGSGATVEAEWVDVIDLDQPTTPSGYVSTRVQMPKSGSLTSTGLSCIPREFDLR